ncbi:MAG: type II toxin-antitoxin system Phd/YefM family antitoxin [Thermoanaerobaculia bacterium]
MKSVGIADLKSRLSEHLREVRRGHSLIVLDRATAIAELVPYRGGRPSLEVRAPRAGATSLRGIRFPPPLRLRYDVLEYLRAERQNTR